MEKIMPIQLNAHTYLISYKALAEKHYKHSAILETWYSNYFFPSVSILTFGIELHFKWLLSKRENRLNSETDLNTHSFDKLFHHLNKDIKKKVVDEWFVFFKIRGGKVKSGVDKYRFFNLLMSDFHDVYVNMRYAHEDYKNKRETFDLLLPLLEPLLFSFTTTKEIYKYFVENIVEMNLESDRNNLENAILRLIISKYVIQSGLKDIDDIKNDKEIWEKVSREEKSYRIEEKSTKELAEIVYEITKGETNIYKIELNY